jgi:hypothetical protein
MSRKIGETWGTPGKASTTSILASTAGVPYTIRMSESFDWKTHGVKVVRAGEMDTNTPQTPG